MTRRVVTAVRLDGTEETMDLDNRARDLDAYDKLGPLARAIVDDSPIDIEVRVLLTAFRERPRNIFAGMDGSPPDHRSPDQQVADFILEAIRRRVPGFKPMTRRRLWPKT